MAASMADTSPGLETARLCSEFRSGNTTKQAATELADLVVTKFIGFSGLTSAESAFGLLTVWTLIAQRDDCRSQPWREIRFLPVCSTTGLPR